MTTSDEAQDQSPETAAAEVKEAIVDYLVSPEAPDRGEYLFFWTASWLFLLLLALFLLYFSFEPWWNRVFQFLTSREETCRLLQASEGWGTVIYILIQAAEVLVIYLPLPVELAGGFLYGFPLGALYATLGLLLGSAIAFAVGRWLERHWLIHVMPRAKIKRFRMLMRRQGTLAVFLIFLIPGAPKDIFCYLLGLTRLSWGFFLAAVTLARLPGTVLLTLQGAQVYQGNYYLTAAMWVFSLLVAALLYNRREFFYERTKRWLPEED